MWPADMKKILSTNLASLITLTIVFYSSYFLLVEDNFLHTSISSIIHRAHHLQLKSHLIVLGLLPIYIAMVIFGSALVGIYLGSIAKKIFSRKINRSVSVQNIAS